MKSPDADPQGLWIRGARFNHSAAKFWSQLIDEICVALPECDGFRFASSGDFELQRRLLFPERDLEHDWLDFSDAEMKTLWDETVAQMNLLDQTDWAVIRLQRDGGDLEHPPFLREQIDADTYLYLLAWLLEWAGIPEASWNLESLRGEFAAEHFQRKWRYELRFELRQNHIHEGLYQRALTLRFQRTPII